MIVFKTDNQLDQLYQITAQNYKMNELTKLWKKENYTNFNKYTVCFNSHNLFLSFT
jgi:hypothetical protein